MNNIFLFLLRLSIIKTECYFASAKSVLVCSQKFYEYIKTCFLTLRNIFIIGQTQWNFAKNIFTQ